MFSCFHKNPDTAVSPDANAKDSIKKKNVLDNDFSEDLNVMRNMPEIIDGSRRKRIARGSGRPVQEINQLLKQFMQMRVMMKKIGKKGRMQIPFQIK